MVRSGHRSGGKGCFFRKSQRKNIGFLEKVRESLCFLVGSEGIAV